MRILDKFSKIIIFILFFSANAQIVLKEKENARLRSAFGITESHVEGQAFDFDGIASSSSGGKHGAVVTSKDKTRPSKKSGSWLYRDDDIKEAEELAAATKLAPPKPVIITPATSVVKPNNSGSSVSTHSTNINNNTSRSSRNIFDDRDSNTNRNSSSRPSDRRDRRSRSRSPHTGQPSRNDDRRDRDRDNRNQDRRREPTVSSTNDRYVVRRGDNSLDDKSTTTINTSAVPVQVDVKIDEAKKSSKTATRSVSHSRSRSGLDSGSESGSGSSSGSESDSGSGSN